jgi:hypothetical protein
MLESAELIEIALVSDKDPAWLEIMSAICIYGFADTTHESDTCYLYTTKPYLLFRLGLIDYLPRNVFLIGSRWLPVNRFPIRGGYPFPVAGQKIFFLGDLDIIDVSIFLWLKSKHNELEMLGLNDQLLEILSIPLDAPYWFDADSREILLLEKINISANTLNQLVGPDCARAILSGRKIELESITRIRHNELGEVLRKLN